MNNDLRIKVENLSVVVNKIVEEWETSEENRITIEELKQINQDLKEISGAVNLEVFKQIFGDNTK